LTLPFWLGTVVVAQSVRHTSFGAICVPTVNVWVSWQNSAQFWRLSWPWPVMNERSSAPVAPGAM
jgi:hypothetical protein